MIVRGDFKPVDKSYSEEISAIVANCLKQTASERPSAAALLQTSVIEQRRMEFDDRIGDLCPADRVSMVRNSTGSSTPTVTKSQSRVSSR